MKWLFLRGLAREQRHWGDFGQRFEQEIAGARVHCLDLPGTGSEWGREAPTEVSDTVLDVRERWLARRHNESHPWALLSMSLGGMVAMEWARLFPNDFSRLVVINASAGGISAPWQRIRWRSVPTLLTAVAVSDHKARERLVLAATTTHLSRRTADTTAEAWAALAGHRPIGRQVFVNQMKAAARFRFAGGLDVPTLILASAGDRLVNPSCSVRLAHRLGAPLAMHPTAGHDIPLDDPAWVSKTVSEWLHPEPC